MPFDGPMQPTPSEHLSAGSTPMELSSGQAGMAFTAPLFGSVLDLGDRAMRVGTAFGLLVALLFHGYASARAVTALFDMAHWARDTRAEIREYLWAVYEVDDAPKPEQPKEEPPPEPEPEPPPPEPEPQPTLAPPPPEDPYQEPPKSAAPLPAAAMDTMTAKDDAQEPYEFAGTIIDNDGGKGAGYGQVATTGQGDKPVTNPKARLDGTPGGTGTAPAATAPPSVDKSRPPSLVGSTSWSCPFPPEADAEGIDQAVAVIVVTVRPDGSPQSVKVVSDPGSGFGRAARMCALGRRFNPGFDRSGEPTTASTAPIRVRFSR